MALCIGWLLAAVYIATAAIHHSWSECSQCYATPRPCPRRGHVHGDDVPHGVYVLLEDMTHDVDSCCIPCSNGDLYYVRARRRATRGHAAASVHHGIHYLGGIPDETHYGFIVCWVLPLGSHSFHGHYYARYGYVTYRH